MKRIQIPLNMTVHYDSSGQLCKEENAVRTVSIPFCADNTLYRKKEAPHHLLGHGLNSDPTDFLYSSLDAKGEGWFGIGFYSNYVYGYFGNSSELRQWFNENPNWKTELREKFLEESIKMKHTKA